MISSLPLVFKNKIINTFGQAGKDWLEGLPEILTDFSHRWSLRLGDPFEPLSYNYVVPAWQSDGDEVVLKAGVPRREMRTEIEALRAYEGVGAVLLLEADSDRGVMLLERLKPGTHLLQVTDDARSTQIAAEMMQRLWRPVPQTNSFPTVGDWAEGFERLRAQFEGGTGPFPEALVSKAEGIYQELLPTCSELVLLHGDLHHWNVLSAERMPWLAIDPKGVIGEPAYDVGAWLRNPIPQIAHARNRRETTNRRVAQLSEVLGFERDRILAWGFAQAVLASWWSYEDGEGNGEEFLEMAKVLGDLEKGP